MKSSPLDTRLSIAKEIFVEMVGTYCEREKATEKADSFVEAAWIYAGAWMRLCERELPATTDTPKPTEQPERIVTLTAEERATVKKMLSDYRDRQRLQSVIIAPPWSDTGRPQPSPVSKNPPQPELPSREALIAFVDQVAKLRQVENASAVAGSAEALNLLDEVQHRRQFVDMTLAVLTRHIEAAPIVIEKEVPDATS